jgi:hypothetical protein
MMVRRLFLLPFLQLPSLTYSVPPELSRRAIIALGGVAPIVLQLVAADAKLRTEAAAALLALVGHEKSVHSVTMNGGISRLVSLISFSPEHDEVNLAMKLMLMICREGA